MKTRIIKVARFAIVVAALLTVGEMELLVGQEKKQEQPNPSIVKRLSPKGLKALGGIRQRGSVTKPSVVKTKDELAKAVPNEDMRAKIAEMVDLEKSYLVFFRWSGSGQDRLTASVQDSDGKKKVVFLYRAGFTRDLRPHAYLFAVSNNATWSVARQGRFGKKKVK